jgi:hypothetical protein
MHDESMPNPRPSQTPVVLRLWIDTPAATSEQLQRGIDAAREVFDKAGTNPWEAACAAEDEARDDDSGETRPPAKNDLELLPPTIDGLRHNQLANAWHEAYWAALTAGFGYDPDDGDDDLSFDTDPSASGFRRYQTSSSASG